MKKMWCFNMVKYFKLLRTSHWLKNLFVFVPLIFSKHFVNADYVYQGIFAFVLFSMASSIVYIFNDIQDSEKDRQHPVKRTRPIASGEISILNAFLLLTVLGIVLINLLFETNLYFAISISLYIIINILYSTILKRIVIVDLLCLASGFMLRVLGGAYAIEVEVSNWLILTTLFLSIFLAVMKRKAEIDTVTNHSETRKVLQEYSVDFVNQISAVSAAGVLFSYAFYSVADRTIEYFNTDNLVFTSVFVVFGVFRYMYLVYRQKQGENTLEVIFKDPPMLINSLLYFVSVIFIIYFAI